MQRFFFSILIPLFLLGSFCGGQAAETKETKPTVIKVAGRFYNHNSPQEYPHIIKLMKENPGLEVAMWSGLSLPGGAGRSSVIMAIAGNTAPDIMESWFHIIRSDISQGFLYPLNEWIGEDKDGDGFISNEEAIWPGWKNVPDLWKRVATQNGKIYGIPQVDQSVMGIIYRTDLARNAGLDPNSPPETWEELYRWCAQLTEPTQPVPGRLYNPGQRGIALLPYGFMWIPWIQSAGGDPIVQVRVDPKTGKEHLFGLNEKDFLLEDGTNLSSSEAVFRANFDSKEGVAAAGLYHKLRWAPWIIDPETQELIFLSQEDKAAGFVLVGERRVSFQPSDVMIGFTRTQAGSRDVSAMELLGRGDVAMLPGIASDLSSTGAAAGVNPDLLSWFPFPASEKGGSRVVQTQCHYATLCVNVGLRPKEERDKAWEVLQTITNPAARDVTIERRVISGLSRFVNPADLKRLGYDDFLNDIAPSTLRTYEEIDNGTIKSFTEPYQGFWVTMDGALNREVLSLIIAQSGENFDYAAGLRKVTNDANNGVMFARSKAELDQYRTPARIVFAIVVVVAVACIIFMIRSMMRGASVARQGMVSSRFLPWLLLFPALGLIGLWGYYPLFKGMVMAFQDFKIAGESSFTGLDNFISLFLDKSFWHSMVRTFYYVFVNMAISFTAPIILAIMLSEIPRGKIFYRTLFFLPQVTSGLVIALLWKMMYDPNPTGLFNQAVAFLNKIPGVEIGNQSWLLDPHLAMICVVLPSAWAGAGISSLLYLAALKSVPEESYEACEIDGGGIFTKLRCITLPVLLPLIIINFVGAFIATFQNMGNIFLLTFGGPGESTMVVGMKIWIEAYSNLRFSMATSMAWVMGACLIGLTMVKLEFLKKIEFRKAQD